MSDMLVSSDVSDFKDKWYHNLIEYAKMMTNITANASKNHPSVTKQRLISYQLMTKPKSPQPSSFCLVGNVLAEIAEEIPVIS